MSDLAGKVAVVTGAASGIGLAAARRLQEAGCKLVLVDRTEHALRELASSMGDNALVVPADVTLDGSAEHFVSEAERLGPVQLAVLNAGIHGPVERIENASVAAFDEVIAVNVRSVWLGLAALIPAMRRAGGGAIVATASIAGLRGTARLAAYSTSKHAVVGLVKSAALETAREGIRINAVCPGPIDTGMMTEIEAGYRPGEPERARRATEARTPMGRLGLADEVAAMMMFLLSDQASLATGGTYAVDGGSMAGLPG